MISKTEIKKFQNQINQYQEFVDNKRILRWNPKKRKFVIVIYHPRWWYVQKFKQNYKKKHGVEYRSKKQKKQAWAKTRAKMNRQNKP
jgi:hypothetical protein